MVSRTLRIQAAGALERDLFIKGDRQFTIVLEAFIGTAFLVDVGPCLPDHLAVTWHSLSLYKSGFLHIHFQRVVADRTDAVPVKDKNAIGKEVQRLPSNRDARHGNIAW